MAIWYETGNGMIKTSFAKCDLGLDVYLCCPGPSLSTINPNSLIRPGIYTVAINSAYPFIRPNLWIGMDGPNCHNQNLWNESFTKICRGGYQNKITQDGRMLKDCCNTYFADCAIPADKSDIFKLRAHDVKFVWHKNTLAITLHILVWMGAKNIYLIGCDLGGKTDYHHNQILTKKQRDYNKQLYKRQYYYLKWFTENAKDYGINLISCSPDSPINDFMPYCYIDTAIMNSNKQTKSKFKHALDDPDSQ